MINNLHYALPLPVCVLVESKFEFTLTGSRFFGNESGQSDWDFFVQDSEEVGDFLMTIGYEQHSSAYADDPHVSCVYRKQFGDTWIDVQLARDGHLKTVVQNLLKDHFPNGLPGYKDAHSSLWSLSYRAIQAETAYQAS